MPCAYNHRYFEYLFYIMRFFWFCFTWLLLTIWRLTLFVHLTPWTQRMREGKWIRRGKKIHPPREAHTVWKAPGTLRAYRHAHTTYGKILTYQIHFIPFNLTGVKTLCNSHKQKYWYLPIFLVGLTLLL